MTVTAFGTNDPRTQKKWSKAIFEYALGQMYLSKKGFIGSTPDSVIQVIKDLEKDVKGDEITLDLEAPLQGSGFGDNGTMIGNSESMVNLSMKIRIGERGHSCQSVGPLSEKRTATNFRESARRRLGGWLARKQETDLARALWGLGNETSDDSGSVIRTVNTKYVPVGVNAAAYQPLRHLIGGQNADGETDLANYNHTQLDSSSTADQLFGVAVVRAARELAERTEDASGNLIPMIRKINIDGHYCYVMLVHPWQAAQLRIDAEWKEAQKFAALRGSKNPLFTSSLGMVEDVIIHAYPYAASRTRASDDSAKGDLTRWIPDAVDSSDYSVIGTGVTCGRAILMGAQAGVIAWGKLPTWREAPEDGGRKPVIGTDMLLGTSRTVFQSYSTSDGDDPDVAGTLTSQIPFATITVDTQIQDPRTMEAAA